jgi:hypothetical protein
VTNVKLQRILTAAALAGATAAFSTSGSSSANASSILTDASFESPALAAGGYQYGGGCPVSTCGSISIAGYGWTFSPVSGGANNSTNSGSGIINATSSNAWWPSPNFSTPTGFDGNQYAFVQGDGAISQTFVAPVSGLYDLTWLEGSRPNVCCDGNQTYQVSIGSFTGTYSTLSGQNFELETSAIFSLIGGDSYTLTFLGLATSGDHTAFIDSVSLDVFATPLPAALPLFATGLGVMGWLARRRKRKNAALAPA